MIISDLNKRWNIGCLTILVCLAACHSANKQNTGEDSVHYIHDDTLSVDSVNVSTSFNEASFTRMAAISSVGEIEAAELAQKNSTNEEIKGFATRMINDHKTILKQLHNLGMTRGLSLPKVSSNQHRQKIKVLSDLEGPNFDKAYISKMVYDHQKSYTSFRKAATSAKDGEIRSFALKNEPVLKMHLEEAKRIEKYLN
jgi:putative membrane protein